MRADIGSEHDPSDGALVERVRMGDDRAFELLVRRHLPRAHSLAAAVLRDDDDANDACQEAFLAALKKIDRLRDPERFRGWLLRIVRNRALNHLKRAGRAASLPIEAFEEVPGVEDPSEDLWKKEVWEALREGMEHLTGMPRRVFLMHEIEGWDHDEIARELGISRGASRVHLFLARRTMRDKLAGPAAEEKA